MNSSITNKARLLAIAGSAAALTAACAASPQQQQRHAQLAGAGDRQCFYAPQVRGFTPLGGDRVQVRAGADTYELRTGGNCRELDWSRQIALRSISGGSWVCQGLDAELLVPSLTLGRGVDRCLVTDVRLLSPQEARASRTAARRR